MRHDAYLCFLVIPPFHRSKIFYYSIIESSVMIAVAAGQVYIVRWLFEKGSTKRYRV
jgi:hypothetical protein